MDNLHYIALNVHNMPMSQIKVSYHVFLEYYAIKSIDKFKLYGNINVSVLVISCHKCAASTECIIRGCDVTPSPAPLLPVRPLRARSSPCRNSRSYVKSECSTHRLSSLGVFRPYVI